MDLNKLSNTIIGAAIEVHKILGFIMNFNTPVMKDGIIRIVNDFKE